MNTSPLDRTLTADTIYRAVPNGDGTFTYLPNLSGEAFDPSGALQRTITLWDGGLAADASWFGNDRPRGRRRQRPDLRAERQRHDPRRPAALADATVPGGNGVTDTFGHRGEPRHRSGRGLGRAGLRRGRAGTDLIFGGLGQDDLIGGSSDLFGYSTRAQRSGDHVRRDLRRTSATGVGLNNLGDTGLDGHSHDADVIAGDNAQIVRLWAARTT